MPGRDDAGPRNRIAGVPSVSVAGLLAVTAPADGAPSAVETMRTAVHSTLVDAVFFGALVALVGVVALVRYVVVVRRDKVAPPSTS